MKMIGNKVKEVFSVMDAKMQEYEEAYLKVEQKNKQLELSLQEADMKV